MNFDIVLVTRNRKSVLELSIPLMLNQSLRPSRFIIVDSSDDHASVARTVNEIFSRHGAEVALALVSSRAGISLQRNIGMEHVQSDVVLFPDDDALWYPSYAEAIMNVYERDEDGLVGGVAGDPAKGPPGLEMAAGRRPYAMTFREKVILFAKPLRRLNVFLYTYDPLYLEATKKAERRAKPQWIGLDETRMTGPMTGFTMSFRANLIRELQFDETLGRYALFEDIDASLRVLDGFLLVKAGKAKVFHYKAPGSRVSNGFEWGVINILNRAYVVCKCSPPGSRSRRNIVPFSLYQCLRWSAQCYTKFGRQRLRGALCAVRCVRSMINSSPSELPEAFIAARTRCMRHSPGWDPN